MHFDSLNNDADVEEEYNFTKDKSTSKNGLRSKHGANSGLYTIDDDFQHKRGNKRYDILS